jgi:hypothetical protein
MNSCLRCTQHQPQVQQHFNDCPARQLGDVAAEVLPLSKKAGTVASVGTLSNSSNYSLNCRFAA